jgi:hypothetical protein
MTNYKIIYDPIHGSIKLDGVFLQLIDTPELQKLRGIHQLGLAYLVFPGANHTRFEHSVGTAWVAAQIASTLKLDESETNLLKSAALLHDIGHGPFSHVLDYVLSKTIGLDHMKLTANIIKGEYDILQNTEKPLYTERRTVAEILRAHDIEPELCASLVTGNNTKSRPKLKKYLAELIHGVVDADQIDFLLRDSHYTGVAYGVIDLPRFLQTVAIHNDELVVHKRGVPAVESMLVARALMFSSIYVHRVVRVSELMLSRALEHLSRDMLLCVPNYTDFELMEQLKLAGGYCQDIALLLKHRRIFKTAYYRRASELTEVEKTILQELGNDMKKHREVERELCARAGLPEGHVIVDIPGAEITSAEPRIMRTDIRVVDDENRIRSLSEYSTLTGALQFRAVTDWALMVVTDAHYVNKVANIVEKVLFK